MIPLTLFVTIIGSVMLLYGFDNKNVKTFLLGFIIMMLSIIVMAK